MITRGQLQVISSIQKHLDSVEYANKHKCINCRIKKTTELFKYMLMEKTKRVLTLPLFTKFRDDTLKKSHELKDDVYSMIKGKKGCIECQKELLDKLKEMRLFLEGTKSRAAVIVVTPIPITNKQPLRRSARLMAKHL